MIEKPSPNTPALWAHALPWPDDASHKHSRGRLAVVCGPRHQTGAARLAARAGQRVGAGWTSLIATPKAADVLAFHETSIVLNIVADLSQIEQAFMSEQAIVFGPAVGLGAAPEAALRVLLSQPPARGLILDADALTLCANHPDLKAALQGSDAILTPHQGEFARLFPEIESDNTLNSRLDQARAAARASTCIVVLKGAETIIAAPDGRTVINAHASPFLASAGTGDVLAGLIGGLCAQGMARFEAACAAVWMHGEASLRLGPGLIAEDLVAMIPEVLNALSPGPFTFFRNRKMV
jgi:ADP-dependent NAD(P)H-hydrate dehydratase / NAD(P)H-hydrate epimerase